ncbi:MAG: hypothetical protein AAGJ83_01815 [Planctomycetota bacterium]
MRRSILVPLLVFLSSFQLAARAELIITLEGTIDDDLNTPVNLFFHVNDVAPVNGSYQSSSFDPISYRLARENTSHTRIFTAAGGNGFDGSIAVDESFSEPFSRFGIGDEVEDGEIQLTLRLDSDLNGNGLSYGGSPVAGIDIDVDIRARPLRGDFNDTLRPSEILPRGTYEVAESFLGNLTFTDGTDSRLLTFSSVSITAIPEPSAVSVVSIAALMIGLGRRRPRD